MRTVGRLKSSLFGKGAKKALAVLLCLVFIAPFFVSCKPPADSSGGGRYTVLFDLNGGVGDVPESVSVEAGQAVGDIPAPSKDGAEFKGWTADAEGTAAWDLAATPVTADTVLYAQWGGDMSAAEYEKSLGAWSEPNRLYIHYKRETDTIAEYSKHSMWVWRERPDEMPGRTFEWTRYDESGAVAEVDLSRAYTDAEKTRDQKLNFFNATEVGIQVVLNESKQDTSSFWRNDGGNVYIPDFHTRFRPDGSVHIFAVQGRVDEFVYFYTDLETVPPSPYDLVEPGSAVSKNNVNSSVSGYPAPPTSPDFYNNAGVGYQIQVASFADSDGDGMGDIRGIIENLDYLKESVHANVLWLTPVQLSNSYHGYDIIDFYQIDPRFGTMADYRTLLAEAHKRGIRVLMDLVVNHTSENNVWFKNSAQLKKGTDRYGAEIDFRNFYTWINADMLAAKKAKYNVQYGGNAGNIEKKMISWREYGGYGYYYYGKFASSMPELNYDYRPARDAIVDVALFWMAAGLDGFRIDAVKHIYMDDEYSTPDAGDIISGIGDVGYENNTTKNVNFFKEFSCRLKAVYPNAFVVGENFTGDKNLTAPYFEGLDSVFDFSAGSDANAGYCAAVRWGHTSYTADHAAGLELYNAYRGGGAINSPFTSNHDTNRSISKVNGVFSQDDNDNFASGDLTTKINKGKLYASVMLTLPGLTWIYYGDELGMSGVMSNRAGDPTEGNLDRYVRQPFKWTTAGFTWSEGENKQKIYTAGASKYTTGFTFEAGFTIEWDGYNKNLAGADEQQSDTNSMLRHYERVTALKSSDPVLIKGTFRGFDPGGNFAGVENLNAANIVSFSRSYGGVTYKVYHNLSGSPYYFPANGFTNRVWAAYNDGATLSGDWWTLSGYNSVIVRA
jgi:glycosidase